MYMYLIAAEVTLSSVTQDAFSLGYPSHRTKYSIFPCKNLTFQKLCYYYYFSVMLSNCNYFLYKKQPSGNWSLLDESASVLLQVVEAELKAAATSAVSFNAR